MGIMSSFDILRAEFSSRRIRVSVRQVLSAGCGNVDRFSETGIVKSVSLFLPVMEVRR